MSSGGLYETESKICVDLALLGRLGFMSFFYIFGTLDPNDNKLLFHCFIKPRLFTELANS